MSELTAPKRRPLGTFLTRVASGALPSPWDAVPLSVAWAVLSITLLFDPLIRYLLVLPHDWAMFTEVPGRLESGRLYDLGAGYYWVWSPLAAWLMAWVFVPLGYSFWLGLHLAVVPLLRSPSLVALTAISVPFWVDTIIGNSVVFIFVAGVLALRGSRIGAIAYLALFVLLPRPIQAPLAIWLLMTTPSIRLPFALLTALVVVVTIASGYTVQWIEALLPFTGSYFGGAGNYGPTRLLGAAWLVAGVPLAAWLTWKGRIGLASVAVTPYLLPQYLLLLLWEHPRARIRARAIAAKPS